jgi:hypothetical protein
LKLFEAKEIIDQAMAELIFKHIKKIPEIIILEFIIETDNIQINEFFTLTLNTLDMQFNKLYSLP